MRLDKYVDIDIRKSDKGTNRQDKELKRHTRETDTEGKSETIKTERRRLRETRQRYVNTKRQKDFVRNKNEAMEVEIFWLLALSFNC
jgi:hypothetical protein